MIQLNPTLVVVLGLITFLLGLGIKRFKWSPTGRPMFWLIMAISLVFGVVHVIISAQIAPFPPMPTDTLQIVFAWIPAVLAWVAVAAGAVAAAATFIYALIIKGLKAPPSEEPDSALG